MFGWIAAHMDYVLAGLMFAEKVVLMSKTKHQDIIVTGFKGLIGLLKKRQK